MIKEVSQTEKTNVDLHEVSTTVKHRDKAGERREVYHGPEGWGGGRVTAERVHDSWGFYVT